MGDGYFAHPTAVIDPGSQIGAGTKIWHFSHIMPDAIVGARCIIGQNVVVLSKVRIGDGCKIQNNVSIYTGVTLEEDVFCGPSMVVTNVVNPRAFIERKSEYLPTLVRRGATIGANATVVCGVSLGRYCMIGAGSVVTRDVPDFALFYGVPGEVRGWVCWCGLQLEFAEESGGRRDATCSGCKRSYTLHGETVTET
ncbi:MAG: DapH/DapD/GlmU-related protein [Steroidobacteraceae bacterium]